MRRSALIASRERPFHKRIRLACTFCRKRKVRCDGGEPCSFCRHLGTEPCVYAGAKSISSPLKKVNIVRSSPTKQIKRSSQHIHTTSLPSLSVPSCSSSPTSSSSASSISSSSSPSSVDFDNIASTSRILPTVQIEQWQDLLSFSNLTAEFNAPLYNKEEDDITTSTLLPSYDYLHGSYLTENLWQPMTHGTSMSSSSFTSSPASSSSAYSASPLSSTMQILSPPWSNTHHWTNQYLDFNPTCSTNQSTLLTSPMDTMPASDALGLCLNNTSTTTSEATITTSSDSLYLSYSSMAQSDRPLSSKSTRLPFSN